jgi:hypothetical protein
MKIAKELTRRLIPAKHIAQNLGFPRQQRSGGESRGNFTPTLWEQRFDFSKALAFSSRMWSLSCPD